MRKLIPALCLGLFSFGAFAGEGTETKASFESLDKNSDQQISMTEAQDHEKLGTDFSKADANGDGFVSREEFEAYTQA